MNENLVMAKWKFFCPKGHRWEAPDGWTMTFTGMIDDEPPRSHPLCPYCVVAFLSEHFPAHEEK